jgi:hypothetical protein
MSTNFWEVRDYVTHLKSTISNPKAIAINNLGTLGGHFTEGTIKKG